jgi:hypothetical protein
LRNKAQGTALLPPVAPPAFSWNGVIGRQQLSKLALPEHASGLAPSLEVQQETAQFLGPELLLLLVEQFELPQSACGPPRL